MEDLLLVGCSLGEGYDIVHLRELTSDWASYLVRRREDGLQRHALVLSPEISAVAVPERLIAAFGSCGVLAAPAHVQVEHAGMHGDTCYVVFADDFVYVSLRRVVDAETFWPVPECLSACQMLALSLAAAWDEGRLVHARLSPDTVYVDPSGALRLLDLGLTQFQPHGEAEHDSLRRDMHALAGLSVFMLTGVEVRSAEELDATYPYLPPPVGLLARQLTAPPEPGASWEPIVHTLSHLLASSEYCMFRGLGLPVWPR